LFICSCLFYSHSEVNFYLKYYELTLSSTVVTTSTTFNIKIFVFCPQFNLCVLYDCHNKLFPYMLIFVIWMSCVPCVVGTEFLHIMYGNFSFQCCAKVQAAGRQPLTMAAWVSAWAIACGNCGVHSGTGIGFPSDSLVCLCQLHFTNVPHPSSFSALLYVEWLMGKAWQTSNRNDALSKNRDHQDTKVLSFFQVTKG
jgi:hypothetical protein